MSGDGSDATDRAATGLRVRGIPSRERGRLGIHCHLNIPTPPSRTQQIGFITRYELGVITTEPSGS